MCIYIYITIISFSRQLLTYEIIQGKCGADAPRLDLCTHAAHQIAGHTQPGLTVRLGTPEDLQSSGWQC